jgi:hypothetical protein
MLERPEGADDSAEPVKQQKPKEKYLLAMWCRWRRLDHSFPEIRRKPIRRIALIEVERRPVVK